MKLKRKINTVGRRACDGCLAGKMKETLNKSTTSRNNKPGAKLHADTSGRIGISIRGFRCFLLVCDNATRYTWVRLLKTLRTQEVLPHLQDILSRVERHTGQKTVTVRADNGKGEFGMQFQNTLSSIGIAFEPCPPYKHSMNGVIERAIYATDCKARSLLYEGRLSGEFWCYAVEHAVYIKNRVPTSALPFGETRPEAITPWHAYTGRLPDLLKLVTFGCTANPLNTLQKHPQKMAFRHKPGYVFLGMDGNKVWKLMNTHTLKIEKYGDAEFNEYRFPLADYKPTMTSVAQPSRNKEGADRKKSACMQEELSTVSKSQNAHTVDELSGMLSIQDDHLYTNNTTSGQAGPGLQPVGPGAGHSKTKRDSALAKTVRIPVNQVFNDKVVHMITSMKAIHISDDDTTSLGVPTAPFEAIDIDEAMREDAPGWRKSIIDEYQGLISMKAFTIKYGKPPNGRKLIPNRLVLRKKFNTMGDVIRLKSRLCIRGDKQAAGIDYFETFASVMRFDTLRALLAKASAEDLEIDHMDVEQAFLNPTLKERIYMRLPPYFVELFPELVTSEDAYLELNKSLYGLKQAPREWALMVIAFYESLGLKRSDADPNLFIGREVLIPVFVDDKLIIGKRTAVDRVKAEIMAQ